MKIRSFYFVFSSFCHPYPHVCAVKPSSSHQPQREGSSLEIIFRSPHLCVFLEQTVCLLSSPQSCFLVPSFPRKGHFHQDSVPECPALQPLFQSLLSVPRLCMELQCCFLTTSFKVLKHCSNLELFPSVFSFSSPQTVCCCCSQTWGLQMTRTNETLIICCHILFHKERKITKQ